MTVREAAPSAGPDAVASSSVPTARRAGRADRWALAAICALVFGIYATYAWMRHIHYETTNYDLGIFDQAVRAYSRFEAPIVPLKAPGYNLLGDHFHPLIAVFAPLYWIWDDPRMLLLAQAALFAASMVPVARFTERRLGRRRALVVALVYGLSWPLQQAVQFDVHEIALAVPLIAVVIDAIDRRSWRVVVLCCGLLLGVREDMGAFVVVAGLLVAFRSPRRGEQRAPGAAGTGEQRWPGEERAPGAAGQGEQRRPGGAGGLRRWAARRRVNLAVGASLVVLGFAGYLVATSVVIPALAPTGSFAYWTFPALGPDAASAARFAVSHPWQVLRLMVSPSVKAHTLLQLVAPTMLVGVASPYILLTLPFLAERMLNSRSQLWGTGYHYSSVLAPTVVMAAVDSIDKITRWLRRRRPAWGWRGFRPVDLWIAWCVGFLVLGQVQHWPDFPMRRMTTYWFWHANARVAAIERVLRQIPSNQCIEAANQLGPHLAARDYITQPTKSRGLASWVVLDMSQIDTGWQTPKPNAALAISLRNGYRIVDIDYPIVLLHKDRPVLRICSTH
ncbi:MAG: DUF2079 domain-containing protein [Kineosporiaceae bacterium]